MHGLVNLIQDCIENSAFSKALRLLEASEEKITNKKIYYALRGDVFSGQFFFEKACLEYKKAIELEENWAPPYNGLGNALVELGQYKAALGAFDSAVALASDIGEFAFNRGQLRLLLGDWSGAKTDYEARLLSPSFKVHPDIAKRPAWLGDAVTDRRVLLYWEQGLGDTLQFVRYARRLEDDGAKLIIEAQDSLIKLLKFNFPAAEVIGGHERLPEFDLRAALPSLPWLYRETPQALYGATGYLSTPGNEAPLRLVEDKGFKVGLVWAGNPNHINDKQRSIKLEALVDITKLNNVSWYSLQIGASDRDKRTLLRHGIKDVSEGFRDFFDTASLIETLDLVITVDTSVAHLAGALGKPVWILLPFVPDWRWLLGRSDSPWYSSAKLFRQPSRGDWASVVRAVKRELAGLL